MEYNERFKLLGFDPVTNRIKIMIKNTGRIMSANFYDIRNTDVMDDLSRDEVEAIYRKAYSSGQQVDTQYDITSRPERQWILYSLFCLIITVCYIFSNISAVKPVFFSGLGVLVTPGVFVYPLTFLIVDLLNEFYGFKLARRAIYMCVCSNALLLLLLSLSLSLPVLPEWIFNSSYKNLVTQIQSAFIASTLAFFCSELANSYTLIKIKKLTKSKYLYVRLISSTFVASVLDSIIFCFIAFYGVMEQGQILQIICVQIAVKLIYALINVFPAYGARYLFNRYLAE
ncbi:queuosine precursor transporter [Serratia symbiotica]|uniref:Probable queuosine precursor transporter n=1 Tax=Serratia symbiotica TaxID=138074 RepID=A0A068Z4P3_9GAMM|nr:queuosine precursor transporter [Serratia symbiotica]QLH64543.1 queuosine precursor transporter [Serratia symbiotica]CDS57142.1 conserved membrane hypothetical protein [Serratia symbiotica]